MVYLRVIYSAEYEMKYIKLQLMESEGYVDKIIVSEFNYTHTGEKRDFTFQSFYAGNYFTKEEKDRIMYFPADVTDEIHISGDLGELSHYNEKLYRGYFVKHVRLSDDDIIILCDADEIVFRRSYPLLLKKMGGIHRLFKKSTCYQLKMYTFFYRPSYLWSNNACLAPIICYAKRHKSDFPAQWRNEGWPLKIYVGCHFSWFLTIDEMIHKLNTYAHKDIFAQYADTEILRDAVEYKKYPFDDSKFDIKEVDYKKDAEYFPDRYAELADKFDYLFHLK